MIGEIVLAQQILNLTIYTEEELKGKTLDELKNIVAQFKAKLNLTCSLFLIGLKEAQKAILLMFDECEQEAEINNLQKKLRFLE